MHALKSILLHLDNSKGCVERVRVARQLAETFDAEVTGLYAVTPSLWRYSAAVAESAAVADQLIAEDRASCDRSRESFLAASAGSRRLSWSELATDAPWGFERHALYADLMVLGQRDPDDPAAAQTPPEFLSRLLIESGRPALMIPSEGAKVSTCRTVLVAWKESREAARAVTAALPWLKRAEQVHVICYGKDPDEPLKALQRHLLSHGVTTTLHHGGPEHDRSGEFLLSVALDVGADLLVMGCYGHSRAREWALGGFTRTVLATMTLPVLMAH